MAVTPTTKHGLVRDQLLERIAAMLPGEALPAERELAKELEVARMTLRRATDLLVAERRLVRRPGAGTFVAPSSVAAPLRATSFSQDMRSRGLRPDSRTVVSRRLAADLSLAALLEVEPNSAVLHVRRLRLADDLPMALEDLFTPCDLVPGLTGEDLEHASFYAVLGERFGLRIEAGQQVIEPAVATGADAELLAVEDGAPVFRFERTSRVAGGRVGEFVRSLYRGDRYRIVAQIYPEPIGASPRGAVH